MVVDDGSSDNTVEVVRGYMAKKESCVKLLVLGSNRGKGGAVKCGVQRATGRHILMVKCQPVTHPIPPLSGSINTTVVF